MQVFLPYSNVLQIVQEMACDKRRYNKQIVECKQIIKAIEGKTEAWKNHPICHQYKRNLEWLEWYQFTFELYKEKDYNFTEEEKKELLDLQPIEPIFLQNIAYLDSHKRRLYQKSPELYPQFKKYNNNEDTSNLYCVPVDFKIPSRKGVTILSTFSSNYKFYNLIRYE